MGTLKAQNALEYLVSYSWMILAVLLIIAVVFYTGVLMTGQAVNRVCTLPSGFSCESYKLANGTGYLDVRIRQNTIHPINITAIKCTKEQSVPTANWSRVGVAMQVGEEKWVASAAGFDGANKTACCFQADGITCYPDARRGQYFKGVLWIAYTELDTGVERSVTGDITVDYE
ncbi:Uncharacterised protein [uncultured archaeon]|nr:Uncharacterised protein [uncultured archaeon]